MRVPDRIPLDRRSGLCILSSSERRLQEGYSHPHPLDPPGHPPRLHLLQVQEGNHNGCPRIPLLLHRKCHSQTLFGQAQLGHLDSDFHHAVIVLLGVTRRLFLLRVVILSYRNCIIFATALGGAFLIILSVGFVTQTLKTPAEIQQMILRNEKMVKLCLKSSLCTSMEVHGRY
jgi:hypothetical protein